MHFSSGSKVWHPIITIKIITKLEPTGQIQDPLYLFLPVGIPSISTRVFKPNQNEKRAERNLLQTYILHLSV